MLEQPTIDQLIQVMSTNSLKKVFDVKPFLDQFNVFTQKKAYIKKLIVQSLDQLKEHNCIENQFQLITKSGITQKVDKLIPLRIGQSKNIWFYEKL
jgi:long-subunit acyl-CoA synthetase (AMP-forming)